MGWFALELEAGEKAVVGGSLVEEESVGEDGATEGDEGGEGRAPVRNRSERAV